jgi:hypothetical protein
LAGSDGPQLDQVLRCEEKAAILRPQSFDRAIGDLIERMMWLQGADDNVVSTSTRS